MTGPSKAVINELKRRDGVSVQVDIIKHNVRVTIRAERMPDALRTHVNTDDDVIMTDLSSRAPMTIELMYPDNSLGPLPEELRTDK